MGWGENEGLAEWDLDKIESPGAAEQAFPANAYDWLPSQKAMSKDFNEALRWMDSNWGRLVSEWFFSGGEAPVKIKKNVSEEDAKKAFLIVRTALGSFQPAHEHKIAGCAWILDKYFEWTDAEQKQINR